MSIRDINHFECPGIKHLKRVLKEALDRSPIGSDILVNDGEEKHSYLPNMIDAALAWTWEIDGVVTYRVGKYLFGVIYDSPYDDDNRDEIIYDGNTASSEITDIVQASYNR